MTGYDQVLFNWNTSPLSKFNEIHPTIRLFNIQSEDDLASLIPLSLDTIDQLNVRLSNIDISSFENVKHFNKLILGTYKPGEYLM